ncbi:ArsR family transcriptional regulator [Arthrobacter alpinus]|nr:ArsR family transcriptional regulator [Arthrobacter alpinus]
MNQPVEHSTAIQSHAAHSGAESVGTTMGATSDASTAPGAVTAVARAAVEPPLDEGQCLSALASLGDPVRKRLFELVRDSGNALSRDDCAAELGLPKSTIRAHLDRLVDEHLLLVEFRKIGARTGPGSGRPTKLYATARREVSASVPPRHYDLAASLLAAGVQHSIDTGAGIEESLAKVAREEGLRMGQVAGDIHTLLAETGYSPEPDGDGGTIMANCPFHRLSQDHQGVVCALNGSLLGGALEGCGDDRHVLAPDQEISHCCARLVPKP